MAVIEAKEKEILNKVDIQIKESHERLRAEQHDTDKQVKLIETGIQLKKPAEALLKRGRALRLYRWKSH